ncbi:MAG: carboxypeptidase-like regulatory domain-containing protein, partial [Planctomycetota bacterium]|nr:carboxypeptidase-like regulatory domain-containing protein [Planctomycetota bacterium]
MRISLPLALSLLLAASCDNIGRVFDPDKGGNKPPSPQSSNRLPPAGGITKATRPKTLLVVPTGVGWPPTTPIVVLFDQSMNFDSISESSGETATHLFVREKATGNQASPPRPVTGSYTLLLAGRLLVFRPSQPLMPGQTFEIFAGKDVRDIDRQTIQRQGVIGEFTADGTAEAGLKVVASIPKDNDRDWIRDATAFLVLSGPVDPTTVTNESFFVQDSQQQKVDGQIGMPVRSGNLPDPRLFSFEPTNVWESGARYEIHITKAIKAGDIELDIGPRSPLATFTAAAPLPVEEVSIGNPSQGFANGINLQNLQNLSVAVDVPTGTLEGDTLTVRVYGNDPAQTASVLEFEEVQAAVAAAGKGTTMVSFAGKLGSVGAARFKDGDMSLAASLARGAQDTGFVVTEGVTQDTVRPSLTSLGPPRVSDTQVVTDLSAAAIFGQASEELGDLSLTIGSVTVKLFGSGQSGRFMSSPFLLSRTTTPTAFTLSLFDRGGNGVAAATNGTIVQRGLLTGSVGTGTLTVVAYDDATLQAISGAKVLIEPGMPVKPSVGRMIATTNGSGTATFTGLTAGSYSITLIKTGYHLASVLDTPAGFASLPLRPLTGATAKLSGTALFLPSGGSVARVGCSLIDEASQDSFVQTTRSAATRIDNVLVRPNRPLLVTAFSGPMPPTSKPAFSGSATTLGAISGARGLNRPPPEALPGDGAYTFDMIMLPSLNTFVNFRTTLAFDLSSATGLDTANLIGPPKVSVLASLSGFPGMAYFGPGFATGAGNTWALDGSYSLTATLDFTGLGPLLWASAQAQDSGGNLTRNRALFTDILGGTA